MVVPEMKVPFYMKLGQRKIEVSENRKTMLKE
jgi:hypothetical protein